MWDAKVFALDSQTVQSAFSRLLQCPALYRDARFFLFIDGLDEYEETLQDDFKAMVQLLLGWTRTAPHAVKLCVSSREENVFMNFFADDKRLRLHDLTLPDMRLYVRDKLQELDPGFMNRLVGTITEKANGIFLWVALVVKSIRASLEDGCGVDHIETEINLLPDELDGLFQYLLDSIAKSHRTMAYQTFAMLQYSQDESFRVPLSIFAYSFLEDYNDDLAFAEKDQPCFSVVTPFERSQRAMVAHKKLNARCKGLAELRGFGFIFYTHRSVVEFMAEQLQHRSGAKAALANFQAADALSQLTLADIRYSPNDKRWALLPTERQFLLTTVMSCLMKLRWNAGLDHAPFPYLQALEVAANATHVLCRSTRGLDNNVCRWYPTSVLHQAAWLGMHDFLDWMASTNSSVVANEDEISSLVYLSIPTHASLRGCTQPMHYAGLFLLLRTLPGLESFKTTYPPHWTVWQSFIASAAGASPLPPFFGAGKILLEFLRRGVNLQVWFFLHHQDVTRNRRIGIDFGSGADRCTLDSPAPDKDRRYYDFFVSKGGKVSLEDYIGFHDFEYKDAVLELLAQQRRASAAQPLPADPPSLLSPTQPAADDTAETDPDTAPAEATGTEPQTLSPPPPTSQLASPAEPPESASAEPKETAGLEDGASPDPKDTPCAVAEETASPEPQEGGPRKLVTLARKEPAQTGIRWLFKSRVVDALLGK